MSRYPMEHTDEPEVSEFICTDCDIEVFSLNAWVIWLPPRCGTCQWIADLVNEKDRQEVRAIVKGWER